MRAFAHLPSKRRVAGVIAFALLIFSAMGAVHHHRLAVPSDAAAYATPSETESGRTADCFLCRTIVSSRDLIPYVSAPRVVVTECLDRPVAPPLVADPFRPSVPRAPPAA